MEIFYWENAFHTEKKIRKNYFAPSEKFSYYAPEWDWVNLHSFKINNKTTSTSIVLK